MLEQDLRESTRVIEGLKDEKDTAEKALKELRLTVQQGVPKLEGRIRKLSKERKEIDKELDDRGGQISNHVDQLFHHRCSC